MKVSAIKQTPGKLFRFRSESSSPESAADSGLRALYEKELSDQLSSKRFYIILALIGVTSFALWLFFAIFMSLIANIIANAVYPIDTEFNALFNSYNNYTLELNLNRISPYYLYSEAVSTIMSPSVRSINVVTVSQLEGAISGYLSLGQSLLLIWPHLCGLFALMIAAFGGSYIGFMRQEIRSS